MHGIDTENFAGATARIRERFPHLHRLSLNGHWNSVFSGLLLPATLQESLSLSTHVCPSIDSPILPRFNGFVPVASAMTNVYRVLGRWI